MATNDAPTTPIELIAPPDGDHAPETWSADLADAEFARLVKGTKVITPVTRVLLALVLAELLLHLRLDLGADLGLRTRLADPLSS